MKVALFYVDDKDGNFNYWTDMIATIANAVTANDSAYLHLVTDPANEMSSHLQADGSYHYENAEHSPIEKEIFRLIELFNNGQREI